MKQTFEVEWSGGRLTVALLTALIRQYFQTLTLHGGIGTLKVSEATAEEAEQAELVALRAVADAARAVQEEARSITWRFRGPESYTRHSRGRKAWCALADALDVLDKEEA